MLPDKITQQQIKALWAKAGRLHVTENALRAWVTARTGKHSIRILTKGEASGLIGNLVDMEMALTRRSLSAGMTRAQSAWIGILGGKIGWDEGQLNGLSRKMYHGKAVRALSRKEASGLIEALKAIGRRVLRETVA